jgi:WD40 repeat protein
VRSALQHEFGQRMLSKVKGLVMSKQTWTTLSRLSALAVTVSECFGDKVSLPLPAEGKCLHDARPRTMKGHKHTVNTLVVHCDRLYSGGNDCTIRVWDPDSRTEVALLEGHVRAIRALAVSEGPSGCRVYSGSADCTIGWWDLNSNDCVVKSGMLRGHTDEVRALAISDHHLYSGSNDRTIRVWDLASQSPEGEHQWLTPPLPCGDQAVIQCDSEAVEALVTSAGRLYAGSGCNIHVCDLTTFTECARLEGHSADVRALVISNDRLYSGSSDCTIRVWDLTTLTECAVFQACRTDCIRTLAICAYRLYSGTCNVIHVWDLKTLSPCGKLEGHTERVVTVATSGSHGQLFSGSRDATIRAYLL